MSPADSFVWAVVAASAAWLFASTVVPIALRGMVALGRRAHPLSKSIATVVAAVLLLGAVRSSPSAAIVPPPTERVIVDGQQAAAAIAIRNTVSEMILGTRVMPTYTVVTGDTLWGIARHILDQSGVNPTGAEIVTAWKMIYGANTDVVGNDPNLILPGQVLTIPGGVHG